MMAAVIPAKASIREDCGGCLAPLCSEPAVIRGLDPRIQDGTEEG